MTVPSLSVTESSVGAAAVVSVGVGDSAFTPYAVKRYDEQRKRNMHSVASFHPPGACEWQRCAGCLMSETFLRCIIDSA